jgi:hypothetical protein
MDFQARPSLWRSNANRFSHKAEDAYPETNLRSHMSRYPKATAATE